MWQPGMHDVGNLRGTTRTLDGVSGATHLHPGLVSRDGWVVYDDSHSPVLSGIPADAAGACGRLSVNDVSTPPCPLSPCRQQM
jgi:hypothetical protein